MYKEEVKNIARERVITESIKALTINRSNSTLSRKTYVRELKKYFLQEKHIEDKLFANFLKEDEINKWENFYDSIVQTREAKNLKVAYLSGPNPENDLREMFKHGILPENVWAFESDNKVYNNAIMSALNSEFPFIKIINGSIDSFLDFSPQKFDIIYLDFCQPIINKGKNNKTLKVITKILDKHSLNSPGILITNVSLPTEEQDKESRNAISKLVATYLYPKAFQESDTSPSGFIDSAMACGDEFDDFLNKVSKKLDSFYGTFVSRLLIDHASIICPYNRLMSSKIIGKIFTFNENNLNKINTKLKEFNEEYLGDADSYPFNWTFSILKDYKKFDDDLESLQNDNDFDSIAINFLTQLSNNNNENDMSNNVLKLLVLLTGEPQFDEFLNKNLKQFNEKSSSQMYYQFCDLVLFPQILEILCRQLAIPYQVNIEKSKRWKYIAKSTPMYMDMMILDECRYLYDWLPTIDMIESGVSDIQRQLLYRFVLDAISKHYINYNLYELFYGTAVVGRGTKPFESKTFPKRQLINEPI